MSAPAGWHLQPDGRERYWDGTQWTDQFRAPFPADPTAPPPPPSWASNEPTQVIGVEQTRSIPTPVPPSPPAGPPFPAEPYGAGPYGAGPYGAVPGAPGSPPGHGAAGGPWQAPPQQGGRNRGCLVAAVVGLVVFLVLAGLVLWGLFVVGNRVSDAVESITSVPTSVPGLPSDLPTTVPTDLPTDLPSLPSPTTLDIAVGEGFELQRARVAQGWTIQAADGIGARVRGMRATFAEPSQVPVVFTMEFRRGGGESVETVCTSEVGNDTDTEVDVSCLPLLGDTSGIEGVTVTSGF